MPKPILLYRASIDGTKLFLRVPDDEEEKDTVLMFNRIMADYGFSDPKELFNERLGVAEIPAKLSFKKGGKLYKLDMFEELRQYFTLQVIQTRDWHTKRF